jgi:hypothetical protein
MKQFLISAAAAVALSVSAFFTPPASAALVPGSEFTGDPGQGAGFNAYGDPWSWRVTLGGSTPGVPGDGRSGTRRAWVWAPPVSGDASR